MMNEQKERRKGKGNFSLLSTALHLLSDVVK
jgi:hypothetical protein